MKTTRCAARAVIVAAAWAFALVLAIGPRCAVAAAEITQSNGFTWCTVGNPSNGPWVGWAVNSPPEISVGAVDHPFRIAQVELTVKQYFPFLKAYEPFIPVNERHLYDNSTGTIDFSGGTFVQLPNTDNYPADLTWRTAARFCNWLHNGRVNQAWAFETGAYDTSTFGQNPQTHEYTDAPTHLPGARYWIPTLDEWMKAAHYDPDRYGSGQPGYWLYPHSSDTAPIIGPPGNGAQSNAGAGSAQFYPVGSYPDVTSPYGLLDAVGELTEWTETADGLGVRFARGNDFIGRSHGIALDRINGWYDGYPPDFDDIGVRIATTVPTPVLGVWFSMVGALAVQRRRSS